MMRRQFMYSVLAVALVSLSYTGCQTGETDFGSGPLTVETVPGEAYVHYLDLFWIIRLPNRPQIAVWVEDTDGNYLDTIYVSQRAAYADWRSAPGDDTPAEDLRRPASLPRWTYQATGVPAQQVANERGPMGLADTPDAVTGSTPKNAARFSGSAFEGEDAVRVLLEVNHSTQFNDAYPAEAAEGTEGYSGGEWGSGQPALLYEAEVDPNGSETVPMQLSGHSSPDGSTGAVYTDLSGITSARKILEAAYVHVNRDP